MTQNSVMTCEWQVTGMDCGSCAGKVRGAVERLPGVSGVEVTMMTERLQLQLDQTTGTRQSVEDAVRALGFGILTHGEETAGTPATLPAQRPWYHSGKGRLLLGTGALLVLAWIVKLTAGPALSQAGFILATLIGTAPIARRALSMLRARMPFTIEMLMTIAATGALVIGEAEEAALVVFLFAVGEMLEGVAANRARSGIRALADLVPKTALRLNNDGSTSEIAADGLRIGDLILTRPGDRIPADGEVTEGLSDVDESPVTGESVPKLKQPGDPVHAGSVNTQGALRIRVTRAAQDNTIARIIRLVEEAESARAPTERFIDRFSRIYMPAVVGTALLVALIPPLFMGADQATWTYRALALLLIGCPCALVISVPASIASALSTGARNGLLLKGGAVIEAAARTTHVAFDKTGTLTRGRPQVTDVIPMDGTSEAQLMSLAAAVETGSSHPLAQAICARAKSAKVGVPAATGAKALPGKGAEAMVNGTRVTVGSPRHAAETGLRPDPAQIHSMEDAGKTVIAVFDDRALHGLIALRDDPRPEAADAIAQLRDLGLGTTMLTGDNARTASAIAGQLGMDHRAELLPEDKVTALRALGAEHQVMMVGDGINDAPALATAQVGMAMGSGTDVALETADAATLRNRVSDVAATIRLSRATMGNIRQNVTLALGLKGVFLVTSVLGITGLWIAILADTGATVLVTLNALRLMRFRPASD